MGHADREHALLSASSASRWLACPPSAAAAECYPNVDTVFTREGTQAHELAEMAARANVENVRESLHHPGVLDAPREMWECAEGYAAYIQGMISDPAAVVLLEQRVDFSPWVPHGSGTCDCVILQGHSMIVIDYKYGQGVAVDAVGNPQMRLYALGALNDYGIAYDVDTIEMVIYQPRIGNLSGDKITAAELLEWAETVVKPTAALAYNGDGEWTPGAHCRFCPHAGRCRALTKVCTDYVETHGARRELPVLAPHEVQQILDTEPLITLWLKRVKDQALADLLAGKEVTGYKVVEGRAGARKWSSEVAVVDALAAAGVAREDYTETKLLTPAALDKALGKKRAAELVGSMVDRSPGAPTVVPATDKRPPFDPLAAAREDFA